MAAHKIHYFYEVDGFKLLKKQEIRAWLTYSAKLEQKEISNFNLIFCDDEYLLDINKQYLNHDYYTDIITFDVSDNQYVISGDVFISIDRAQDNSKSFNQKFEKELHRLMIHGLLHLIGYNDKSDKERANMTRKEDYYLSILDKFF